MKSFKVICMMIVCSIQGLQATGGTSTDTGLTTPNLTVNTTTEPIPRPASNTISTGDESKIETDDKSNPKLLNTLPAVNILNLSGTDANGKEIKRFLIQTLPDADAGILYLEDGQTALIVGQFLSIQESDNIRFDPNENFEGITTFTYSSVARNGAVDNSPATVTFPIISATTEPIVPTTIVGGEHNNTTCPVHVDEDCSCDPYEASIPAVSKFGILLMIMLTIFMGRFFIKKEI